VDPCPGSQERKTSFANETEAALAHPVAESGRNGCATMGFFGPPGFEPGISAEDLSLCLLARTCTLLAFAALHV
jgi:hypothetical protein